MITALEPGRGLRGSQRGKKKGAAKESVRTPTNVAIQRTPVLLQTNNRALPISRISSSVEEQHRT